MAMMTLFRHMPLVLLSPDEGGGAGGVSAAAAEGASAVSSGAGQENTQADASEASAAQETAAEAKDDTPAWFSQLKKESREKYRALSRHRTLDELADAALRAEDADRSALKIPGKDASKEEIREYLDKIGVPQSPEGYQFPRSKDEDSGFKVSVEKTLRDVCFRNALSGRQAQAVYGMAMGMIDTIEGAVSKQLQAREDSFDASFEDLFRKDYPDKAKRKAAMTAAMNGVTALLNETGIGKAMKACGAVYDPDIMKALGEYASKRNGSFTSGSQTPGSGRHGGFASYGKAFSDAYGKK